MCMLFAVLPMLAQQSPFDKFVEQQTAQFDRFKADQQAEWDAYRKRINDEYADFMRKAWKEFPVHEAEKPRKEQEVPPVVYEEPKPEPTQVPQSQPALQPVEEEKPQPRETIYPITTPKPAIASKTVEPKPIEIPVKPVVVVVPTPQPAPEPIAPVAPQEEEYKKVSIGYFGSIITIGFPINENIKLRELKENAIADVWKQLSDSRYDITIKTALDARQTNNLCDWGYMKMLQAVTEKHYGKTNEAVLVQAFLMTQSGYRIRLGRNEGRLYMLVASQYDIFHMRYYTINGTKFYNVNGGEKSLPMQITEANYGKEQSLSLQMSSLPKFNNDPTPKRTLTSRKGVTSVASVNKNMIDFFNTYPQAYFNGDVGTQWASYANTPMEKSVKDMLYPPLKKTISGMSEKEAVGILLNWVQTAFEYEYDDKIWGRERAFFAQETLYYPYCDCEDRAILFSRLVRDLVGLDVVLLNYPEHLAAAVAFNENVKGDYLMYKNRKYVVCDPTYINAGVGRTMPNMNNREAQIIALQP